MAYKGIDVSSHNGNINWKQVKGAGVDFVIFRMGYSTTTDKKFVEYYTQAKANGFAMGGYWFSYALNTTQAIQEADACIKLLKQYPLNLPVYYDFEDDTERWAKQNGVVYTKELRTSIIQAFCNRLKTKGYSVGVYINQNYIINFTNWSTLKKWPLWLAKWVNYSGTHATGFNVDANTVSLKWGTPDCWQFSDSGKIAGISGNTDINYWYKGLPNKQAVAAKSYPDNYTKNGLTFQRCKSFRIVYHDAAKVGANYYNYINAGFFGNFRTAGGQLFTLPVANLVCDPWNVPIEGRQYILSHIKDNKLIWNCTDNHSNQFKNKNVSTLIVPRSGKPYVSDIAATSADNCLYAISGVPTVRNYDDVDYYRYVKSQGWDESCMGATSRNWLGIRDGQIWIITGKTTSNNYIYGMEFWNKVKDEEFQDIICLDGGGSYIYKKGTTTKKTSDNRRVNTLIVFT